MTTLNNKTNVNQVDEVKGQSLLNKTDKSQSAYGLTVETICQNPNITKEELLKVLEANNINIKASSSAITTGISQVVKVIRLLAQNGYIDLSKLDKPKNK